MITYHTAASLGTMRLYSGLVRFVGTVSKCNRTSSAAQNAAKSTSDRAGIAWRFCVMVCRATGCSQALTNIWHV